MENKVISTEYVKKNFIEKSKIKCKNCKYFIRNNIDNGWGNNKYGSCNCDKFVYGGSYEKEKVGQNDRLFYEDFESYSAGFEVGENFGCIHWEKNEI